MISNDKHLFRAAQCIGCGCDDFNACVDAFTGRPCHWKRLDSSTGLGVCSACPDAIERWDEGDRKIAVPVLKDQVVPNLEERHSQQAQGELPPVPYDVHERELEKVMDERDNCETTALELAQRVGEHFGFDVGEYSGVNCPIMAALEADWPPAPAAVPDTRAIIDELGEWLCRDLEKAAGKEWYLGDQARIFALVRDVAKRIHFYRDNCLPARHSQQAHGAACPRCHGRGSHVVGPADCPSVTRCNLCNSPAPAAVPDIFDTTVSPAILAHIDNGADELQVRRIWDDVRRAMLTAAPAPAELKRKQGDIDALLKERDELKHHVAQYQDLNGALQRDCAMYIARIDQLIGKEQ